MKRKIHRAYEFTDRDINEALVQWLRAKDMPTPEYVGNAGTTKWSRTNEGMRVEWSEESEVEP